MVYPPVMITVRAFATFRALLGARERALEAPAGSNVRDVLVRLGAEAPALREALLAEQGELRPHVSVFLNGRDVRHLQGLATSVRPGDVLALFPPVAGG